MGVTMSTLTACEHFAEYWWRQWLC